MRLDVNAPLGSLDPIAVWASGSSYVFPLLYSYLFVPDANGNLQPDLAVRWAYQPEKRCWKIRLRDNALFHNGQPVSTGDVIYSLEKWVAKHSRLEQIIARIISESENEITIYLHKKAPRILHRLWSNEIMPQAGRTTAAGKHLPVGSGPFEFQYRDGRTKVVLKANRHYYNGRPALERIIFYYQPKPEKKWPRLLTNATDVAFDISPLNYEIIQQYEQQFYFDHYTLKRYTILLYNTEDPLFASAEVRKALTLAIDRDHIVKHILNGYGRVAAGPMGVESPYAHPAVRPLAYAPERAIAQLNKSGWLPDHKGRLQKNGRPFEFTIFVYKGSHMEKTVARFIQLSLNDLGIKVHLKALGFDMLHKSYFQNNDFQAVLTELNGIYRNPEDIGFLWSRGRHGNALVNNFKNSKLDGLLDVAFSSDNSNKRKKSLQAIDALIADLQPGTFLFHKTAVDAMSRRFFLPHRFALTHEGVYRLKNCSPNDMPIPK